MSTTTPPIIPNPHPGLVARFINTQLDWPAREFILPVVAWDYTGRALVPGNHVRDDDHLSGRLIAAVEYAKYLQQAFDDAWRLFELDGLDGPA